MIKIISCHPIFNENAIVLSQKYKWEICNELKPESGDIYIVFGANELAHELLEFQCRHNIGYIILNSEQPDSQFMKNKYYIKLMKMNVVFDYSSQNMDFLKKEFEIKTFSYFFFEFMYFENEQENKEYDIVFVGTKNKEREDIYNQLKEKYPNLNILFDFDWSYKSSDALTKLYHNTKVVLNIPYYKHNTLETHRINKAISCGCDVISLKSSDEDANEFYKDYVYMTEDILDTIDSYLKEPESKKPYPELVKQLSTLINPHFLYCVNMIYERFHKKI